MKVQGVPLVAGSATGRLVRLTEPLCFWGGLDPATGAISDPRHPQHGAALKGRVAAIPAIVGSSSSSQFLLEAMRLGNAPSAILLGEEDIIIATAVFVGREMAYTPLPIVRCDFGSLVSGATVRVDPDGQVHVLDTGG